MTSPARNGAVQSCVCVTAFSHDRAVIPDAVTETSWEDFVEYLVDTGHARSLEKTDESIGLFSLYRLKDGKTRAKDAVAEVSGWVLDLDKATDADTLATRARLDAAGLTYVVYSTHGHTEKKPKLRILGPLLAPVAGKDWPGVWRALVDTFTGKTSDESCKDSSRMYYFPSCKPGASPVFEISEGESALDVRTLKIVPKAPRAAADDINLNAPELLDNGIRVERAAAGTAPFAHAEHLCRTMPAAVSGSGGHVALLRLARALRWGLNLDDAQCADLIGELYNPRCDPEWTDAEIDHKVEAASSDDGAPYAKGALLPPPPDDYSHLPVLVQNAGRYWLRPRDSDDYRRQCNSEIDLRVYINKHYDGHEIHGGTVLSKIEHIGLFSHPVASVVSCYYQPKVTYDPETEILVQGLRTDETLLAQEDAAVEAFLAAFAGERLQDVKQWIAGCRPDRLTAPSRALAVVGRKGLGKSLFAHALARIWNQPAVRAEVLCARFNGDLARCPIVLADEELPKGMTGEGFRTTIQERRHSIEPKGKERNTLEGAIRLVIAINGLDKLHLLGTKGADDIEAIADRLCIIQVPPERADLCKQLTDALMLKDGSTVDVARMARHFLYIQATVEPAKGRFIGAQEDASASAVTLAGELDAIPELFDLLRDFFTAAGGWAKRYRIGQISGIIPKRGEVVHEARANWPIIVRGGRVFCRTAVLAKLVGRELSEVRKALKPFMVGQRCTIELESHAVDVHELSTDSLLVSLGCDLDSMAEALCEDSEDLHGRAT